LTAVERHKACPACGAVPVACLRPWLRRCPGCGLWSAELEPDRPERTAKVAEAEREEGLRQVRLANFATLLDALEREIPLRGARLLEVGCGHGWFLAAAAARGVIVTGIEPDADVAARSRSAGLDVRAGYFPEAVNRSERFDALVFNDVFEHLPEPDRILDACARLLRPRGRLVLNLPDADGLLFRTACALARLGVSFPLERLWQAHFRFPHLWYFNARTLERLLVSRGFRLRQSQGLPALKRAGLWSRLRMDRTASRLGSAAVFVALWPIAPLLAHAPDILLQIYEPGG
jgi:SAM-dependent methyltransferase